MSKKGKTSSAAKRREEAIVIDADKGLVFANEEQLYQHFINEIQSLEAEFFKLRRPGDIDENDFVKYEKNLNRLLEDPDEVWEDKETIPDVTLTTYLREFESRDDEHPLFHVAVVYLTKDTPSFVYLHFPTRDLELVRRYQRGELIYDQLIKNAPPGAIEGDALLEGDELASGLYRAMLMVRSDSDIPEEMFRDFAHYREMTIEEADEIWRANDSMGNVLVSFIKDVSDDGHPDLHYVVVTVEDTPSNSHALLFSFPTMDKNLLLRYRHGENLQAEEVVQEASH